MPTDHGGEPEYSARSFGFSKDLLQSVLRLDPARSATALALVWLEAVALISLGRALLAYSWLALAVAYIPLAFFIAGRQGALLNLLHESAHNLLSPSRKVNRWVGRWLCGFPIGIFQDGYASVHMRHHAYANTELDPPTDRNKYTVVDFKSAAMRRLLLEDLLGITALRSFFAYGGKHPAKAQKSDGLFKLGGLCLTQALLIGAIFQFDMISYLLFWIIPIVSPNLLLMRIRGVAEHGLPQQLGLVITEGWRGGLATRSFLTAECSYRSAPLVWLEKALIGSLSIHYHHEHHIIPAVPFYHLSKVHEAVRERAQAANPNAYAPGYFAAALKPPARPQNAARAA